MPGNFLYLIKDNERVFRVDFMPCIKFNACDKARNVKVSGEQFFHALIVVKVDVYRMREHRFPNSFISQVLPTCLALRIIKGLPCAFCFPFV
jgi:hypothetical protein